MAARTAQEFNQIIGALNEGALCFPYPFDVSASAGLAANNDHGLRAISRFALARRAYTPRFRIQVHEIGPADSAGEEIEREIVGTVVHDMQLALHLVEQAALDNDAAVHAAGDAAVDAAIDAVHKPDRE